VARFVELQAAGTRVEPVKRLRAHGENARDEILAKARHQLAAGHEPHAVLEFLAHSLTNRLLHAPTAALRQAALEGDHALARASEKLFPIDMPPIHMPPADMPPADLPPGEDS
jgi:glutamyl-tRNA reductase